MILYSIQTMNHNKILWFIFIFFLHTNLLCMDYSSTTEELKKAVLTKNQSLLDSTWDFAVVTEQLDKAVFAKDYPLVLSILEKHKDNKEVQKLGLQYPIPIPNEKFWSHNAIEEDYYFEDKGELIPLYHEKNILRELLQIHTSKNFIKKMDRDHPSWVRIDAKFKYGIKYPLNLLAHACFFNNVEMLKELLSSCKDEKDFDLIGYWPNFALALALEYDNLECFKILYGSPFVENWCIRNGLPWKKRRDLLKYFALDAQKQKIVEALLKSGCVDSNHPIKNPDSNALHYSRYSTLLDVVLARKDKFNESRYYKRYKYYKEIARLLRQYGGKTTIEIAAMHPFNGYLIEDIKTNIINRLDLLDQQKLRLVCSQWKKIVDDNPVTKNSQSYYMLRNPKQNHSPIINKYRVLCAAHYDKDYSLIETILECSKKSHLHYPIDRRLFLFETLFLPDNYNEVPSRFVSDKLIKQIYWKYHRSQEKMTTRDAILDELIQASFLEKTEKIEQCINLLKKELENPNSFYTHNNGGSIQWDDNTKTQLLHAFLITADYDYAQGMSTLISALRGIVFFDNLYCGNNYQEFLHRLILASYNLKSLKVLEVLLSSDLNINQIDNKNHTIKDEIIDRNKAETDDTYIASINSLFHKYGAKTYEEVLRYNKLKRIILGSLGMGITAAIVYFLFKKMNNSEVIA